MASERFSFPAGELRHRTARGVLVNGTFILAAEALVVVQQVLVARFLSAAQVGLYGIVSVTVITLLTLKQVGIDEQFVQQDEADQEVAFQRAFTLELILGGFFALGVALLAPVIAVLYDDWRLAPLMLALAYLPLAFALQAPAWIFLRRMDFVRQRVIQAAVPTATFVVTLALLLAGLDVWALVIGALVGNVVAAAIAALLSPYKFRFDLHRPSVRVYARFSWPILFAAVAGLVIRQGQVYAFDVHLGLAGAGFITLAVTLTRYADRADQIVTATIYPAICAVTDRSEVMTELFMKSNRVTAMWALPVRRVPGAVRPRPRALRARRQVGARRDPAPDPRDHRSRPPARLQLDRLLPRRRDLVAPGRVRHRRRARLPRGAAAAPVRRGNRRVRLRDVRRDGRRLGHARRLHQAPAPGRPADGAGPAQRPYRWWSPPPPCC